MYQVSAARQVTSEGARGRSPRLQIAPGTDSGNIIPFFEKKQLFLINTILPNKVVNLCSGKPGLPVKIVLPLVAVKKTFIGKKI